MGDCEEAQNEEIQALQSIFEESIIMITRTHNDNGQRFIRGNIDIHPVLPDPFYVESDSAKKDAKELTRVQYLPPMTLHFKYVRSYPSVTGPAFLLTCHWLSEEQLAKLCKKMDEIWQDCKPEVIIFRWMSFLQEEALIFLGIKDILDISHLKEYVSRPIEIDWKENEPTAAPIKPKPQPTPPRPKPQYRESKDIYRPPSARVKNEIKVPSWRKPPKIKKENGDAKDYKVAKATNQMNERNLVVEINQTNKESATNSLAEKKEETTIKDSLVMSLKPMASRHYLSITNTSNDPNKDSRAVLLLINGSELRSKLIEYNERCKREHFEKEWVKCKVCLTQKQGREILRFQGCDHLYCKECMQNYFTVQIQEGNVQRLTCPEEKCSTQALPHQVQELVGKELYARYDKILLDVTLSQMTDVTTCPRKTCQCFIMLEPGASIAECSACKYPFCIYCRKTYHGLEPCRFREEEKKAIREKYTNGTHQVRYNMELKYGKKELMKMINDGMSEDWVQLNSKKCPHCNAAIEKSDGCNKMVCWRCNTYFCWLCSQRLSPTKPYLHYNDPKSTCFNHLFLGTEINDGHEQDDDSDEEDWRIGMFL